MIAPFEESQGITALLGPTNTGKTHRAIERMLEHSSGMMGLPLRLLAREIYDKLTERLGESTIALVTGEEKRVPKKPRYWICTVEAMPMDVIVDFVAIDEIQLGAHPERGHVFTDRLLNARGRKETWFLGSETVRPLIERLLPLAKIRNHPRLSRLHGIPPIGLNALPKRSAVVAFSAQRVYEIGERIRRKHGGAALVLGALSPRTRNAQVALYQSGEVDFLVATDAIGMGLNLDISHIVFSDLSKFDGRESRPLDLPELAQIAGRAGRYLNDGYFSVLAPMKALPKRVQHSLEHHHFPKESRLFFRNSELDLTSLSGLVATLSKLPYRAELRAIQPAEDHRALIALQQKPEIQKLVNHPTRVALLWDVCQIPDFRQLLFEIHVRLLEDIFIQLAGPQAILSPSWVDEQVLRIDRMDGDIETLMARIAAIRTWNYVAQRKTWLVHGSELAERCRHVEDKLSDALHQALLSRFVERKKTHVLAPKTGVVRQSPRVKAHPFAQLLALSSKDTIILPSKDQTLSFVDELVDAAHEQFGIDAKGSVLFRGKVVGTLVSGVDLLHPDVKIRLDPDPGMGALGRVHRRLIAVTRDDISQLLQPLRVRSTEQLTPAGRGLLYQLEQGLGNVERMHCWEQIEGLTPRDRQLFQSLGLKFGYQYLFFKRLLTEDGLRRRLALAGAFFRIATPPFEPLIGHASVRNPDPNAPSAFAHTLGFVPIGPRWLRIDTFERFVAELEGYARNGEFTVPRSLAAKIECESLELYELLRLLGYSPRKNGRFGRPGNQTNRASRSRSNRPKAPRHPDSPTDYSPTDNRSEP
jgi:ATP-dependent RNA helicase SUPV3L1/SUV3